MIQVNLDDGNTRVVDARESETITLPLRKQALAGLGTPPPGAAPRPSGAAEAPAAEALAPAPAPAYYAPPPGPGPAGGGGGGGGGGGDALVRTTTGAPATLGRPAGTRMRPRGAPAPVHFRPQNPHVFLLSNCCCVHPYAWISSSSIHSEIGDGLFWSDNTTGRTSCPAQATVEGVQYIAKQLSDDQVQRDPDPAWGQFEQAKLHTYHVNPTNPLQGQWRVSQRTVTVCIQQKQFNEGSLRNVFKMRQRDASTGMWKQMVAKNFKESLIGVSGVTDVSQWHYREVESQIVSKHFADEFNARDPPKKCDFIVPYCIEMCQRPGNPLYNVEVLFDSDLYEKHNTNAGGVTSDRLTPQAYSHFSFVHSGKRLCVCDIQGVLDMYTDPQVHTGSGQGFGQGNLGLDGIHRFLGTHICNDVCRKVVRICFFTSCRRRITIASAMHTSNEKSSAGARFWLAGGRSHLNCHDRLRTTAETNYTLGPSLRHHLFQGLTQPRIIEQEIDVQCPEGARPGELIDWHAYGPDGACHDWMVRSKAALEFHRLRIADCPLARTCQGQTAH